MGVLLQKPPLYHASPKPIEGGVLTPGPQHTCVYEQFKGTPEQCNHEGNLLFAGQSQTAAYAYAFKTKEMCNCGVHSLADGDNVTITIIADKDQFLHKLHSGELQPTIYRMPQQNAFEQVHDKNGKPMGEWTSRQGVSLTDCQSMKVESLDEAMEKGVQVFFLKPGLHPGDWHKLTHAVCDQITAELKPLSANPHFAAQLSNEHSNRYFAFLQSMVDQGIVEHHNATRQICPLDLQQGALMPTRKPSHFVEHVVQLAFSAMFGGPDMAPARQ